MANEFFNLLTLPISPRQEDVEPHLKSVAEIIRLDHYTLRQRLQGKGTAVLKRDTDEAVLAEMWEKLTQAGYPVLVYSDSEFRELHPARRAVSAKISEEKIEFLDSRNQEINHLAAGDDCLIVAGNLQPESLSPRELQKRCSESDDELLSTLARGEIVIDLSIRGRPPRIRIFGRGFNFSSMGDHAQLSAVQNALELFRLIRARTSTTRADLSFGLGSLPPSRSASISPTEMPSLDSSRQKRLQDFENHSRAAFLAFLANLTPVKVIPRPESTPGLPAPPDEARHTKVAAAMMSKRESKMEKSLSRIRQIGPPAVVLILLAAIAALVGVFWATKNYFFLLPAGSVVGLLFLVHGFVCLRRTRRIENIPTSKIRSMAMGPVEVSGKAESTAAMKTPFSGIDCVWYRFEVQEYRQSYSSRYGRQSRWVTVSSGDTNDIPFLVDDGTGKVLVDPRGAVVEIGHREVTHRSGNSIGFGLTRDSGRTRIIETFIPWQYPVYVMGVAQHHQAHSEKSELVDRLRELKQDPGKLKQFDVNGDGKIDHEEWETARAAVERELLEEKLRSSETGEVVFIGRGQHGEMFMVSDKSEHELLKRLKIRMFLAFFAGAGIIIAAASWATKWIRGL